MEPPPRNPPESGWGRSCSKTACCNGVACIAGRLIVRKSQFFARKVQGGGWRIVSVYSRTFRHPECFEPALPNTANPRRASVSCLRFVSPGSWNQVSPSATLTEIPAPTPRFDTSYSFALVIFMPTRFVFITDSHYHPAAPRDFGAPKLLTRGREVLDAMVPAVNALEPEFIVHGGDLLCGGNSFEIPTDQYLESVDTVAGAYEAFNAPVHIVPGNHDCDATDYSFDAFAQRFRMPAVLNVVEPVPGLRLALANVYHADPRAGAGSWSDALDQALRQAAAQALADRVPLLLVLHPWILPNYEDQGGVVADYERVLATVSECPAVAAVLTGHRHMNRVRPWRDFLIVDTACLIGYPVGFRELTLRDDGLLCSRFHQLFLPDFIQASRDRVTPEACNRYEGEVSDRDFQVLLPRVRELRRLTQGQ